MISLVSILKNSEYENINLILLYNDINQTELEKINLLKDIRSFTIKTYNLSDIQFKDLNSKDLQEMKQILI